MKITVDRQETGEYTILICNDVDQFVWINDEAHSNIVNEAEALARADALRGATGWPIHKEYEL
jgi:hypothetical protein